MREKPNKIEKLVQKFLFIGAIGFSIFLLFFFIGGAWIGYEAKNICLNAKKQYRGDCVKALSALLEDTNREYRERNNAIWALGQYGDKRALPALNRFYTGNIPNHEPLDKMISQYELKKAITLAKGNTNIIAFIWRSFFMVK